MEFNVEFTLYVFDDKYLNMEFVIPRYGYGPDFSKVTNRLREKYGLLLEKSHNNIILDTRMYKV